MRNNSRLFLNAYSAITSQKKILMKKLAKYYLRPRLEEIEADLGIDVFSYELVFIAEPVYNNLGPQPVMKFLQRQKHRAANLPAAPEKPSHFAVVFCTFGGGHTGIGEAIPLLKYMGQAFEHEDIRVVEEWPVVGDFPEIKDPFYNTAGRPHVGIAA